MNRQNCLEESLSLENCHYFKAARRKEKKYIYKEEKKYNINEDNLFWCYKNKYISKKVKINFFKIFSTLLFVLTSLTTSVLGASGFRQPIWDNQKYTTQSFYLPHTAKCYSCMSTFYGAVWPAINHVYKKPKNFTNKCNEDNVDSNYVPATMCSTICVHMWEDANVGGVKIKGHIRGCLDDILINGFNQTVVTWYRWMHRDSCRQYRKRELFKIPSDQSDESMVNVCTCYSDHCNSGSQVSHCSLLSLLLVLSIIIFKEILERR